MSVCISRHGEFGSHTPDPLHTCTLCGVLDEDALRAELAAVTAARTDDRRRLAAEIKAWRDKNDFARSPDWWQAIDEILDIIEPGEATER